LVRNAVSREGMFIYFVSDLPKNRIFPHQRRVIVTVKNEAHSRGR
jgi:hypothetical protein